MVGRNLRCRMGFQERFKLVDKEVMQAILECYWPATNTFNTPMMTNWSSDGEDMSQPRWTKVAKTVQLEWSLSHALCGTI